MSKIGRSSMCTSRLSVNERHNLLRSPLQKKMQGRTVTYPADAFVRDSPPSVCNWRSGRRCIFFEVESNNCPGRLKRMRRQNSALTWLWKRKSFASGHLSRSRSEVFSITTVCNKMPTLRDCHRGGICSLLSSLLDALLTAVTFPYQINLHLLILQT